MKDGKNAFFKMLDYLEDRGFYIILTLCIVSIGISGYVFFFSDAGNDDKVNQVNNSYLAEIPLQTSGSGQTEQSGKQASAQAKITVSDDSRDGNNKSAAYSEKTQTEDKIKIPSAELDTQEQKSEQTVKTQKITEEQPNTQSKTEASAADTGKELQYCRPVSGKILHGFSNEQLEYSPTMDDWRSHNGTDFEAALGEKVKAVMAGTVEDIYEDEIFGTCVVIDHSDNKKTVYTGLMKQTAVEKGDAVKAGTVIGGVGDTSIFEAEESGRIHIEYINDGKYQNIEKILPS